MRCKEENWRYLYLMKIMKQSRVKQTTKERQTWCPAIRHFLHRTYLLFLFDDSYLYLLTSTQLARHAHTHTDTGTGRGGRSEDESRGGNDVDAAEEGSDEEEEQGVLGMVLVLFGHDLKVSFEGSK
jgi:hypothetical protein